MTIQEFISEWSDEFGDVKDIVVAPNNLSATFTRLASGCGDVNCCGERKDRKISVTFDSLENEWVDEWN
jgi:hypothetical protein